LPGEREVLVRVHVATVNRTDCGFRAGKPFFLERQLKIERDRPTGVQ